MAKKKPLHAATAALQVLDRMGISYRTNVFEAGSDHFGAHAAAALQHAEGADPDAVLKTLVIDLSAGRGPKRQLAVCVLPVTTSLSLKKAAAAFGVPKATLADPADAQRSSGYIPGGISPIGQKRPLPTRIDETAQLFDTVYVSGGRRGLDVVLAPADLARAADASFADIAASL